MSKTSGLDNTWNSGRSTYLLLQASPHMPTVVIAIKCLRPDRGHGRVVHVDRQHRYTAVADINKDVVNVYVEEGEQVVVTMFTKDSAGQYDSGTPLDVDATLGGAGRALGTNGEYQWIVGYSPIADRDDCIKGLLNDIPQWMQTPENLERAKNQLEAMTDAELRERWKAVQQERKRVEALKN